MKTLNSMLLSGMFLLACAAGAAALDSGLMPGETAEAPSPAAEALWHTYTEALSAGDWSTALYCVDIERLRASLLERRLADLRAHNPGLSAGDLDKISAVLQARELDEARVRAIIADMWSKADYAGSAWQLRGWQENGDSSNRVWFARGQFTRPDGAENDYVVGMTGDGDDWQIDLDAVERLQAASGARSIRVPEEVPLPEVAGEIAEGYWKAWQAGDPEAAWALLSPRAQQRRPLAEFTQSMAALTRETGVPVGWKLLHCRALQPHVLGLGYEVVAKGSFQALMILVENDGTWSIEDVQVRREAAAAPAAAPAAATAAPGASATPAAPAGSAAERPFAPDLGQSGLHSDFRTPLAPPAAP